MTPNAYLHIFVINLTIKSRSQAILFAYILHEFNIWTCIHMILPTTLVVVTGNIAVSDKLLKSPLLTVWSSAIVVFSITRILVRQILAFRYTVNTAHTDCVIRNDVR